MLRAYPRTPELPDGIKVNVEQRVDEMVGAERRGVETALPQMPAAPVVTVEALGVDEVRLAEGSGE